MKNSIIEIKLKEKNKRAKESPLRSLLKIASNVKKKKHFNSSFINDNEKTKLIKVSSAGNINLNNYINNHTNKKNLEINNNENINYNSNIILKKINNINYINQNFKNSIKNNKNIVVNNKDNFNKEKKINIQNNNKVKNITQKKSKLEQKKIFRKNEKIFDNNMKIKINNNNYNHNQNINNKNAQTISDIKRNYNKIKQIIKNKINKSNDSLLNSKIGINNKKDDIIKNKYEQKNNNKNTQKSEDTKTNRNSSCINFYNKYLKNNYNKKTNDEKFFNIINNVNTNIINNNNIYNEILHPYSTINNNKLHKNRYNNSINGSNISTQNKNIIFRLNNDNINKVNNILINSKTNSLIYSPKKGLYRVHSQENINNYNIEQTIPNSNMTNKNKSLKDLVNFTYSKKNIKSKQKLSIGHSKKNEIYDFNENYSKINDNVLSENNIRKKKNNIRFDIKKDFPLYLQNPNNNYNIQANIYPDIKINLRKKNKKNRNNSAILEGNNNINNKKDNLMIYNYIKKTSQIYYKFNSGNRFIDKKKKNNKNISCSSLISNINKSGNKSNSNLSYVTLSDSNVNNGLNNMDIIPFNNINTNNLKEKLLSFDDLYYILIMEEKIKDMYDSLLLGKTKIFSNFCFDFINFFYNYSLDKCIQNIINNIMDLNNINIFNNNILFSVIIFYDIIFCNNIFKSAEILIKEIIKLIYCNIILVFIHVNNILKNMENNQNSNDYDLFYIIINNILNKYINNKELYIDESEYSLLNKDYFISNEEKINYNINFIKRNNHTIINNMKYTQNFNHLLNLLEKIDTISVEEIIIFFRNNILRINIFNSSLLSSTILKNNYPTQKKKLHSPYITSFNKKKYTLVLSLDETLVYFKSNNIANNKGLIQLRPGLIEFLQSIKPYYEIIIFSNGNRKYSDVIIDLINEKIKCIDYRLYQEHCIIINNDFVKDLSKIGRPIDKIIIVDNLPQNYRLQKENGINIKSFYGDNPNDKILYELSDILVCIAQSGGDVRKSLKMFWNEINFKVCSNVYFNYYK